MNERGNVDVVIIRSDQIEEDAGRWLERREFGGLTVEEEDAFEIWKTASVDHYVTYVRLDAAWRRTERLAALRRSMFQKSTANPDRKRWPVVARHAAVIVTLGLMGAAALFLSQGRGETTYATAVGDRQIVTLQDGSHVELNTDTIMRTHINGAHRVVYLDRGEAYFAVAHDAKRPFAVIAANHRIVDLGTKFIIRENPGELEVSLIEGRARLEAANASASARSTVLTPGDIAVATAHTTAVSRHSPKILADELGWRRGVIIFDNTPLATAVSEVNRYNRTKLAISDPAIARLTITGTFPTDDFEIVLAAARDVYGLRVSAEHGEILISR